MPYAFIPFINYSPIINLLIATNPIYTIDIFFINVKEIKCFIIMIIVTLLPTNVSRNS